MKKTVARSADPKRREDEKKKAPPVGPVEWSVQELQERAFTKTEVLTRILATQDTSYYPRHWGINE